MFIDDIFDGILQWVYTALDIAQQIIDFIVDKLHQLCEKIKQIFNGLLQQLKKRLRSTEENEVIKQATDNAIKQGARAACDAFKKGIKGKLPAGIEASLGMQVDAIPYQISGAA